MRLQQWKKQWKSLDKKSKFAWGFFGLTLGAHLVSICLFSVNIPYWDEWDVLSPHGMTKALDWSWIFAFHTENRQVTAKIMTWLFLKFDNWNLKHQIILNNLFYVSGVLLYLLGFIKLVASRKQLWWLPLLFSLFFSPQMNENTFWAFQANYLLTFFFLAGMFYTIARRSLLDPKTPFVLLSWSLISAYSMGFGLIITASTGVGLGIYLLGNKIWQKKELATAWCTYFIVYAMAVAFWFVDRAPSSGVHEPFALESFIRHQLALWTLMMGSHAGLSVFWGLVPLGIFLYLTIKVVRARNLDLVPASFFLLGIIATLLMVSMARHQMGAQQAYSSRYFLYAFLAIPFLGLFWLAGDPNSEDSRHTSLWISVLIFVGFLGDWSFSYYSSIEQERLDQRSCIQKQFHQPSIICGHSFPDDLRKKIDRAQDLGVSFVEDLQ